MALQYLWVPEKTAFIPSSLESDYVDAGWDLGSATPVTDEMYHQFISPPPIGKLLADVNGLPGFIDEPEPSDFEKYQSELIILNDNYTKKKNELMASYMNAVLFDGTTEVTRREAIYAELQLVNQQYSQDIEDLDQRYGG
ncbi:TPA: hypothetical protein KFT61_000214 [Escherichia coli]|uniref:hypothetical protein n=1 Tax=Enterobacter roggenkampii TaxID=1812935 RepID=UPI001B927E97|nr:hypothetical protein [Enterobacter roggenkampii]MEA5195379.1 hypothetical protein [Enterobacter roggenkampii]HBD0040512.1 hypothetical protein [Escherichia coli]